MTGDRIGVDASTMEANAALRNTGESYREMLEQQQLARESGISAQPTIKSH